MTCTLYIGFEKGLIPSESTKYQILILKDSLSRNTWTYLNYNDRKEKRKKDLDQNFFKTRTKESVTRTGEGTSTPTGIQFLSYLQYQKQKSHFIIQTADIGTVEFVYLDHEKSLSDITESRCIKRYISCTTFGYRLLIINFQFRNNTTYLFLYPHRKSLRSKYGLDFLLTGIGFTRSPIRSRQRLGLWVKPVPWLR